MQPAFLLLLDRLDRQTQLLAELVVWLAVQVRNAGVDLQYGLHRAEGNFARLVFVGGKGHWQCRALAMIRQNLRGLVTRLIR